MKTLFPQRARMAPLATAWNGKESTAQVDHLAYLAGQRVTIAQETAASRAAQSVTEGAAAERDKVRLALITAPRPVAR